jgi:hypothetical protein
MPTQNHKTMKNNDLYWTWISEYYDTCKFLNMSVNFEFNERISANFEYFMSTTVYNFEWKY